MTRKSINISELEIWDLKILYAYLITTLSVDELKKYEKTKKIPVRIKAIRTILRKLNQDVSLDNLISEE